jgi:four helix bundle protein
LSFALKIVKLVQTIIEKNHEYVISKQILKSGTAIGALIREANFAESKKDFVHKLHVALKEANEAEYWLCILKEANYILDAEHELLNFELNELIRMLTSSIKTVKSKL